MSIESNSWVSNNIILSDRYTNGKWVTRNRLRLLYRLSENLNPNAMTLLDLGCGEGTYSIQLLQFFTKCTMLVGLDISREEYSYCKS